uniref:Uncharacterized protein n=1 Tax=Arundo donax TaxID=35708 RepID=A0A0A8Z7S7_ARUDO
MLLRISHFLRPSGCAATATA